MKKLSLTIALAALLMFVGCKKENENETKGTILKASIEQNMGDKTSLHPMGNMAEIHWTAGDKILVNNGTASQTFTLAEGAGTKNGTFNYDGDYTFGTSNVAVYPETATISGNTVSFNMPATQTATAAGTFGNGANPMLGTFTDPEALTFTSLCGVLGVSLTGNNVAITGIEIVSNSTTDKLNGLFEADCTAANPVLAPATGNSGTNRIMLNCTTTLTTTPKEFYIVLPVGVLPQGFTMNVYNGGTTPIFSKSTASGALVVQWNMVKTMATLEVNAHPYVDLGLPSGLLWATCNVGADSPENYGDYFVWGCTEPYTNTNCNYSENPDTLPPEHDAATVKWGDNWRMPTKEEWQELLNHTTVTWTTQNGVNGCLFTASNRNNLFLPAAGYCNPDVTNEDSIGYYWSSSRYSKLKNRAWYFYFDSDRYIMQDNPRYYGKSVRPVHPAPQK